MFFFDLTPNQQLYTSTVDDNKVCIYCTACVPMNTYYAQCSALHTSHTYTFSSRSGNFLLLYLSVVSDWFQTGLNSSLSLSLSKAATTLHARKTNTSSLRLTHLRTESTSSGGVLSWSLCNWWPAEPVDGATSTGGDERWEKWTWCSITISIFL